MKRRHRLREFGIVVFAVLSMPSMLCAAEVDGLALPEKSVTVASPVQDIIAELFVEEGDTVVKDQPLARLRNDREKTELERYQKILEKKEFDNQAAANLREQNILSKEKALATAAELALAKLDVQLAQIALDEKTVASPINGIVTRKHFEVGESVDRIQPLFEIVDIDRLRLQFFLKPASILQLKLGDPVTFWITAKPEKKRTAEVEFVSPAADSGSGLFRVRLLIDNPGHETKAGLRVTAEFPGE